MAVGLELYGRLLAKLACRPGAIAGILGQLGIDANELRAAEPALRTEIAKLWDDRKGVVAMKFAAALGGELGRLAPLGGEGEESAMPNACVALASATTEARPAEQPSYLRTPPAEQFVWNADMPSGTSVPPHVVRPSSGGVVDALPMLTGEARSTPMQAGPTLPVAPAAGPAALPDDTRRQLSLRKPGTGTVDANDADFAAIVAAVRRDPLPFLHASEASRGTAVASPQETTTGPRADRRGTGTVDATDADFAAIVAAVRRDPVPFLQANTVRQPTTPAQEDVDLTQIPLEAYATISSALARGESRDEVLAAHRLSVDGFMRAAAAWAQRFEKEPSLSAKFRDLVRQRLGR